MMLKDLIHIVWEMSPSVPHYVMKIYPLLDSWEIHVSRDTEASCLLVALLILNIHTHPFGIINPNIHCYMNSVIQLLFSILRTISHNFQFNSSAEGSISKFLFEIARSPSSSTDVDALKLRMVQYDTFYSGEQQEDASECLMMLIELINKSSVPYCGSNDNNSTGVALSEILISFMLEKHIVCDACGLRSTSFESSSVLYITPTCTSSMQELIKQGMGQKLEKSCLWCRTLGMSNLIIFYNLLNISLLLLIDLDILTTILPKTDDPYPWIWRLYLVSINSGCRLL